MTRFWTSLGPGWPPADMKVGEALCRDASVGVRTSQPGCSGPAVGELEQYQGPRKPLTSWPWPPTLPTLSIIHLFTHSTSIC